MGGYRDYILRYIRIMEKKMETTTYIVYLPQARIVYEKDASEYNWPVSVKHMECFTRCRGDIATCK